MPEQANAARPLAATQEEGPQGRSVLELVGVRLPAAGEPAVSIELGLQVAAGETVVVAVPGRATRRFLVDLVAGRTPPETGSVILPAWSAEPVTDERTARRIAAGARPSPGREQGLFRVGVVDATTRLPDGLRPRDGAALLLGAAGVRRRHARSWIAELVAELCGGEEMNRCSGELNPAARGRAAVFLAAAGRPDLVVVELSAHGEDALVVGGIFVALEELKRLWQPAVLVIGCECVAWPGEHRHMVLCGKAEEVQMAVR